MCDICRHIQNELKAAKGLSEADKAYLISRIGEYLDENGGDPDHFDSIIDEVLGTTMPQRDAELERLYEGSIHKKDS